MKFPFAVYSGLRFIYKLNPYSNKNLNNDSVTSSDMKYSLCAVCC